MRRLAIAALVVLTATATAAFTFANDDADTGYTSSDIMGVWTAVSWERTNEEGTEKNEITMPNMMMFTAKHYAMMRIGGEGERELLPEEPTDEQRLAAYQRFMANAGAYKVDGNMLVTKAKIARSPNAMHDPQPNESMIHMDGDMMHRTWKNAETGNKLVVTYKRAE
jgi:hypothetical protein